MLSNFKGSPKRNNLLLTIISGFIFDKIILLFGYFLILWLDVESYGCDFYHVLVMPFVVLISYVLIAFLNIFLWCPKYCTLKILRFCLSTSLSSFAGGIFIAVRYTYGPLKHCTGSRNSGDAENAFLLSGGILYVISFLFLTVTIYKVLKMENYDDKFVY